MAATLHAILATVSDRPGMLFGLTKVLAEHGANIRYVDMHTTADHAEVYLEFAIEGDAARLVADLRSVDGVIRLEETPSFAKIYGKRIIIMGGGAQVGQVALGAIAEAERRAREVGVGADRALIAAGAISEQDYVAALARHLGMTFERLDDTPRES